MARQTLEQFLNEMAKKSQTLGWDVVLAFDRNKTNYLLLQSYISRFGKLSLFPPVNSTTTLQSGQIHQLVGLRFDAPRLSFEDAQISDSRARCLMRTVGGRIIQFTQTQGTTRKEVRRVGIVDGLVGPLLTMTIHLKNAPGLLGSAGRVEIDLAGEGAADFKFSGVDTVSESVALGLHVKEVISRWSNAQKKFQLSELRRKPTDALQPGKFIVLTRPMPGATLRTAEDFGDGEVLVLIGLDSREGDLPPGDTSIPYLLPQGYSSNLIISNQQFIDRMIMPRIKLLLESRGVNFKCTVSGGFSKCVADSGAQLVAGNALVPPWGWAFTNTATKLPMAAASGPLSLHVSENVARLTWQGESEEVSAVAYWRQDPSGSPESYSFKGKFKTKWELVHDFKAVLGQAPIIGRPILQIEPVERKLETSASVYDTSGHNYCKDYFYQCSTDFFEKSCYSTLDFLRDRFEGVAQSVDAFRLNGLLFADDRVVVPSFVAIPGDLTILGNIAVDATKSTLSHHEVTVAAEGTHTFTVEPANPFVSWKVEALPGEAADEANIGKITSSGQYTAPTAASFGSTFKRVIVTATLGVWTGKALVHVVAAPVSVFPLVNVVNLTKSGDEGHLVLAGSTQAGALTWKINGNAGGRLVVADEPGVQDARRYYGPATFPTDGVGELDQALRVDRIEVSQGSGPAKSCEMLLTSMPIETLFIKYMAVVGGLKLGFWLTKADQTEISVPADETTWYLVSGRGTLSESGVYTYPTTGMEHYIIVAAFRDNDLEIHLWNYRIIPFPLVGTQSAAEQWV